MERFLKDCDNELELIKENEVVEEIDLVTIVDPSAKHENVEVIIENDLQNGNQVEEQRSDPRVEERFELRTPKQNGIAERRNKSITKAARAMLAKNDVSKTFWRESMNIIVYL